MNEVMNYIFGSMKNTEVALRSVGKTLNEQAKINKSIVIFSVVTAAAIHQLQKKVARLDDEVKRLSNEIEEMKQTEGE